MIELDLIYILSNKDIYYKYNKYIKNYVLTDIGVELLKDINEYYELNPTVLTIDWKKFDTWWKVFKSGKKTKQEMLEFQHVFTQLASTPTVHPAIEDIVKHFIKLDFAARIDDKVLKIIDGDDKVSLLEIQDLVDEYIAEADINTSELETILKPDLTSVLAKCVRSNGAEWRLEDLNVSIGPLHKGDLVIVAARPEVGKTTFITSEITHMLGTPGFSKALIFNNEEMGEKIVLRGYQSATNQTVSEINKDPAKTQTMYKKEIGDDNALGIVDRTDASIGFIEKTIRTEKPDIIVFNVLDKVKGFKKAGNEVERLRELFQWARGLARKYECVVFAVAQADGSAEGQQWVYQDQIYGSKTGVQGEADVIITIGKVHDPANENDRFIHVPKNKLPGGSRTDPKQRHGYHQVEFDGDRGRYNSIKYRKTK